MREDEDYNGIPVTTDIPMLRDQTTYKFYIIRKGDKCSNTEIKAIAKLCNVNYIEAKNKLTDKIVFIADGDAYKMKDLQQIISAYDVIYEINPPLSILVRDCLDNGFVLSEIFGENDIFTGAVIDNIKYQPLGFNMKIDVLTKCNVSNSSPKWKTCDIICLKIELFGVKEFQALINHELLHAEVFTISKDETMYVMKILESNKSKVFCKFGGGRIQRIIPMKYNDEFKGYEKA